MSQHAQEKHARDRSAAKILNQIADEVHESRHLIEVGFMASQDLPDDQANALAALLNLISRKLKAAAAGIEAHARKECSTDAA